MQAQEIGGRAVEFTLRNLNGEEQSLAQFVAGKKGAVVLFWSGICSHCVRYDQYLNGFGAQHKEVGLVAFASRHG